MFWPDPEQPIGASLAALRKRRGLSATQLAARLRVSKANVHRIEHGGDLRVSTLLDIARELGMEPVFVPKETVGAVRALLRSLDPQRAAGETDDGPRFG